MPCDPADIQSGALEIGYYTADTGARPISPCDGSNPNNAPWLNANMWLEGGVDAGTAKVGVVNTVKVRVKNVGTQPYSLIHAEIFVCNFTLGINAASSLDSSNPGHQPMTAFASGPVSPGGTVELQSQWTPVAGDATLNGGHVCMAANCYAEDPQDGTNIGVNDFKICCNCHHGQRNIAVRSVAAGQNIKPFRIMVNNINTRREAVFTVGINEVRSRRVLRPIELQHLASTEFVRTPDLGPLRQRVFRGVEVDGSDVAILGKVLNRQTPLFLNTQSATDQKRIAVSALRPSDFLITHANGDNFKEGRQVKFNLGAGESKPVDLQFKLNPKTQPGDVNVFDVVQRDENGDVVGGARVLTLVTE